MLSQEHYVLDDKGKKLKFTVEEKDVEHLISDALYRTKGTLFISDIKTLHQYFPTATYVETVKDRDGRKGVFFHYYKISIDGREMLLNIEDDKNRHSRRLHSITSAQKTKS